MASLALNEVSIANNHIYRFYLFIAITVNSLMYLQDREVVFKSVFLSTLDLLSRKLLPQLKFGVRLWHYTWSLLLRCLPRSKLAKAKL